MLIFLLILSVLAIVFFTTKLEIHPFLALLLVSILFGIAAKIPLNELIAAINEGFGKTLGSIGLVILLGVLIGTFLENSGGAYRLAASLIRRIGEKNTPWSIALIGFIVSIPVFADSGFVILSPLNKALSAKSKTSLAITAICLSMGLMATHVMVPPTPGPIATAGILKADLGLVIFWGIIVSFFALIPTVFFAKWMGRKSWIKHEIQEEGLTFEQKVKNSPSFLTSVLPIIIPLLLIVSKSFYNYLKLSNSDAFSQTINFLGEPIIALLIGFGFALLLPKKLEKKMLSEQGWVGKAILDSASIIMITGAGGVFGKILQQAGLANLITELLGNVNMGLLLPFLLAAAIKTAQGSSTVAMITTASVISPLTNQLGLITSTDLVFTALTIGAGSAFVSHVNDSFFWVVTKLSNMDVRQGYKHHSAATVVLGSSAFLIILVLKSLI